MITIIDFHNFQKKRNKDIYMYLQYDEETIKEKSVISELSQRERERERGKERERETCWFTLALAHSMIAASLIRESPPASCLRILSV